MTIITMEIVQTYDDLQGLEKSLTDVDTEVMPSMGNSCSQLDCSNSISISFSDNTNDGSKQPPND